MGRGVRLVPLLAAGAVLAACGGGDEEEAGDVAGVETVQTVEDTARAADAFATQDELRWLARLSRWIEGFSRAGGRVHEFESGPRFQSALAGDTAALSRYRRLLEPIRACPESFGSEVGPAPTTRLQHSERNLIESCEHFRKGVDLLLRALEKDDTGLADRARYQIEDAGRKAAVAVGALPPGEKQELPVGRGGKSKSRIDPGYGAIASKVAGKEVEARCWSTRDWRKLLVEERVFSGGRVNESVLGFASAGGERIHLGPPVCRQLDALVYEGVRPHESVRRHELAMALVVLVHESRHAAGAMDEPTAECEAIQLAEDAARAGGIEPDYARALVQIYWETYPGLPAEYHSPECRAGGKLDLSPGDGRFP